MEQMTQVIAGTAPITDELAVLLERVLVTSADCWKKLEAHYQEHKINWEAKKQARREKRKQQRRRIKEAKARKASKCIDNQK
jgi:plasmid maintenance system antidote protein VapI